MAEDGHTRCATVLPNITGDDGAISKQSLASNYIHRVTGIPFSMSTSNEYWIPTELLISDFDPQKPQQHNNMAWVGQAMVNEVSSWKTKVES